jgi:hypothetical protein
VWGELQFLERLHKLAYSTLDEEKEEPTDDAIKWV